MGVKSPTNAAAHAVAEINSKGMWSVGDTKVIETRLHSPLAQFHIRPSTVNIVGLISQVLTGQTTNAIVVQDSAATPNILFKVDQFGGVATSSITINSASVISSSASYGIRISTNTDIGGNLNVSGSIKFSDSSQQTTAPSFFVGTFTKSYSEASGDTSYTGVGFTPKLLTLKARTTETAITFDGAARTDYKLGYFVDITQTKDTGFQYFVDQFYPSLESSLQQNKTITKFFNLTEVDVASYDQHKMIWDGHGYYLPKIDKFIPGKITKVVLFKVS